MLEVGGDAGKEKSGREDGEFWKSIGSPIDLFRPERSTGSFEKKNIDYVRRPNDLVKIETHIAKSVASIDCGASKIREHIDIKDYLVLKPTKV